MRPARGSCIRNAPEKSKGCREQLCDTGHQGKDDNTRWDSGGWGRATEEASAPAEGHREQLGDTGHQGKDENTRWDLGVGAGPQRRPVHLQ